MSIDNMDSFKQIWGAEGCSSSESGWTAYIASPMQEDDAGCSNENDGYHHDMYGENRRKNKQGGTKVDEEESDDSMASDASSGPIHYSYAHGQSGQGTTAAYKKDKQDHHGSKNSSKKNANKQEKKRVDSRSKK